MSYKGIRDYENNNNNNKRSNSETKICLGCIITIFKIHEQNITFFSWQNVMNEKVNLLFEERWIGNSCGDL